MNEELLKEYTEWLAERQDELTEVYKSIFILLQDTKDFDYVVKEIGNPLLDFDNIIIGLKEYKEDLVKILKPKEPPKFKLED